MKITNRKKDNVIKDVETEVNTKVEAEIELIVKNTNLNRFVDIEILQLSNPNVVENLKAYF